MAGIYRLGAVASLKF